MVKRILLTLIILLATSVHALKVNEPLNHYGIATVTKASVASSLASRLNGKGKPIFLISNIRKGVSIGDVVRFQDKLVIIDKDIWATMKSTGVLSNISTAGLTSVKASSKAGNWWNRARKSSGRTKKAYELGGAIQEMFKDYFKGAPRSHEIVIEFNGGSTTLSAPKQLLDQLKLSKKPAPQPENPPNTTPQIVTEEPGKFFVGEKVNWQIWAVDEGYPHGDIDYGITGKLPPGLKWNRSKHTISGKIKKTGKFTVTIKATNSKPRTGKKKFVLVVDKNKAPKISGTPNRPIPGSDWSFTPHVSDPDHLASQLKFKASGMPKGMTFDDKTMTFSWKKPSLKPADISKLNFGLTATDPVGAKAEVKFTFTESKFAFKSRLSTYEIIQGQEANYTPVAFGPGTQSVTYRAYDMRNQELNWDKDQLKLYTTTPGTYAIDIVAEDNSGAKAFQRISYDVLPGENDWFTASWNNSYTLESNLWDSWLYVRYGGIRFGVLGTDVLDKIGAKNVDDQIPFLTAGFNVTGDKQATKGNTMFLDAGINFKASKTFIFGGFFLGIDGKHGQFEYDDAVFEYKARFTANQGIYLPDPEKYDCANFDSTATDDDAVRAAACADVAEARTPELNHLLNDSETAYENDLYERYQADDNVVLTLDFNYWMPLVDNLWIGPAYWLEQFVNNDYVDQRLALAFYYHYTIMDNLKADLNLKLGFNGAGEGAEPYTPTIRTEMNIHFGRSTL